MGKISHFAGLSLIILPLLFACSKKESTSGMLGEDNTKLRQESTANRPEEGSKGVFVQGELVPTKELTLRTEFSGQVQELAVDKGSLIEAGEPILRIEDPDLPEDISRLRSELELAENQLALTQGLAEGAEIREAQLEELEEEEAELAERDELEPAAEEPPLTFAQLASEIDFTPVEAGGIWPEIDPRIIANARDAQDAGGIWPAYAIESEFAGAGFVAPGVAPRVVASFSDPNSINQVLTDQPRASLPISVSLEEPLEEEDLEAEEENTEETSPGTPARLALDLARVNLIQTEISLLENELTQRTILAPLAGRVADLAVEEDSEVEAGDFLMEINQINPITFRFSVPKEDVKNLQLGMVVQGQLSDDPTQNFEGIVSYIAPELNEDQETVEVRAQVDNPTGFFQVGMKAGGQLLLKPQ